MSRVSTYLNFNGQTEEAFRFYASVFGTEMPEHILESMGHELRVGNNVTINLEPDTKAETDRLYAALTDGGRDASGLTDMPWAYWGTTQDRFGVRWMFNCYEGRSWPAAP